MKAKDIKIGKNLAIRPSVVKMAEEKAKKMAKKMKVSYVSFSQFVEVLIYDYNAE